MMALVDNASSEMVDKGTRERSVSRNSSVASSSKKGSSAELSATRWGIAAVFCDKISPEYAILGWDEPWTFWS